MKLYKYFKYTVLIVLIVSYNIRSPFPNLVTKPQLSAQFIVT